jgi:type VI secretion system protein VasI
MKLASLILPLLVACSAAQSQDEKWRSQMIDDPAGYSSVAVLQQDSATTIKDEYASNDVTPVLEFRCTPGDATITARIDWQRFISSFSTEAGFKVDGGRFTWLKWKVDPSEKVTMSPSPADSQKLIDLLVGGSELLVEISPYSEGPVTASYDLAGLADALDDLRSQCQ